MIDIKGRLAHFQECSCSDDGKDEEQECDDDKTSYVMNGERKVPIAALNFNKLDIIISRPTFIPRRKACANVDLIVKKIKVCSNGTLCVLKGTRSFSLIK